MTDERRSDAENWAKPTGELHVGHDLPANAINRNLEGRRVGSLAGGFGKMYQKTYKVRLTGADVSPQQVITSWRKHFPEFWPKGSQFFGSVEGVRPGDVVPLNLKLPGGMKLMTGILVAYADDVSFSFIMPEGGMFNAMITFSSHVEEGVTVAQAQALLRSQDPLYDVALLFGGFRAEDKHWFHTLTQLGKHFGVQAKPELTKQVVDKKRQWGQWRNVKHNAAIRSVLYQLGRPFRALRRKKPDEPSA